MNPFIEARNAALSPIPVKKGTKIPAVSWKAFQEHICSELQAAQWGNGGGFSIGLVTGDVSGRLMCLDFEAGFMDRIAELRARLDEAGVLDVFESWFAGYRESTPRGGFHVLVRLEGEGECPRNDVFAADPDGHPLIETRGEGGYVLVAPSPGYQWAKGCTYDTIVYCTLEEWAIVEAVLRSFDTPTTAATPTVATRSTVALDPMLRDSWIDDVKAGLPSIPDLLLPRGWQWTGSSDDFGKHLTRPGKQPREGASASLSHDGYLHVHSTNAGLPTGVGLDAADILICWETGQRDAPSPEQRTEFFRRYLAQRPPAEVGAGATPAGAADLNLPDTFWQTRPYLTHIWQAALSSRISPDAVWEAVKCFYAATIPWNHRLPNDGTVDYIAINVGLAGTGKSRAKHTAWRLLEDFHNIDGVHFPVPVGSGEGMTDQYIDRTDNDRRYKNRGLGFYSDEGKFLLDISQRAGNTTMQAIKQMWSGELTGSVAASVERHRWLDPHDVRATLLISTTPEVAAEFMSRDYTDEGLPQRISWGWAHYPHPDTKPDWPGPLTVQIWDHNKTPDQIYELDLHPDLATLIDNRLLAASRGQHTDGLEGHATYATYKTAAIHTHLDGRLNTNLEDWALAETDWETTRTIRHHIAQAHQRGLSDRNTLAGQAQAYKEIAKSDVHLERAVLSLIRKVKNSKEPLTKDQIRTHLASFRKRHQIPSQEVIDLALTRGLVTLTPEERVTKS